MRAARCPALRWITVAFLVALCVAGAPAAAQQPAPTPPATPAPTAAPPTLTAAPPTPTVAPVTPTVAPVTPTVIATPGPQPASTPTTAHPILVLILGKDRAEALTEWWQLWGWPAAIVFVLFSVIVAVAKPWRERFVRWVDRIMGGRHRDLTAEVEDEDEKKRIREGLEKQTWSRQADRARNDYLQRLERDMRRMAKIPALGREQRELDLEQVYIPLYVVEREQIELFTRYNLGEFVADDEARARSEAYRAVQERHPVFRLLSEPDRLPRENDGREDNELRIPRRLRDSRAPVCTERLLLVGRAGSGKTTTLHYGALVLAQAARTGSVDRVRRELQLFTSGCPFPVYARLTEVMTYVHERYRDRRDELVGAPPALLLDALDELAPRDAPNLPAGALRSWIEEGGCLVMLDGLDETGDASERGAAIDLINAAVHECPKSRFIVASRPFEGMSERLHGFTERHLRPLDADDIRKLLNRLFRALRLQEAGERKPEDDPEAIVPEAAELWQSLERNPRLFDMATNPLLLTSMVVLVEGREPLPVERAKVYEKLVRLTIEAWRKAQLSRDRPGIRVKLFDESDDSVRLRLQLLAAAMLEQGKREITLTQARDLLRPVYRANNPDWNDERCDDYVRDLLTQLALHSGLIQARDIDALFSFTHFTLQEYLAARHYTEQGRNKEANVTKLIERWSDRRWRETILLAIGHEATSGSRETARFMLDTLLGSDDPEALLLA
ncbi:MAG: NACHT domain-containing protein, partial [Roseiflexus sp.]|nr:NACHT domain-containing protein [Roseiflexus sp.]